MLYDVEQVRCILHVKKLQKKSPTTLVISRGATDLVIMYMLHEHARPTYPLFLKAEYRPSPLCRTHSGRIFEKILTVQYVQNVLTDPGNRHPPIDYTYSLYKYSLAESLNQ